MILSLIDSDIKFIRMIMSNIGLMSMSEKVIATVSHFVKRLERIMAKYHQNRMPAEVHFDLMVPKLNCRELSSEHLVF